MRPISSYRLTVIIIIIVITVIVVGTIIVTVIPVVIAIVSVIPVAIIIEAAVICLEIFAVWKSIVVIPVKGRISAVLIVKLI